MPLGEAPIFFGPARAMADISVEVNRANPRCSLGKDGACTCFYCDALRRGRARTSLAEPYGGPYVLNKWSTQT